MNELEIAKSLSDAEMEAVIDYAIEAEILQQCARCEEWIFYTELQNGKCQHCQ